MTQIDDDTRRRAERARRVGLFRYELIQEVIDPTLSTRAAGPDGACAGRGAAYRSVRGAGPGIPPDDRPLGPVSGAVAGSRRWCRPGPGHCAHPGRGAGDGGRRSSGRTRPAPPPRSPGSCVPSPGGRPRNEPCSATSSAWLQHGSPLSTAPLSGGAGGVRPVRGRSVQRAVGRRRAARPRGRRPENVLVRLPRRPVPGGEATGSASPRTPSGWPPRCARRWPPGVSLADLRGQRTCYVDSWLLRACASLGIKLVHSTPGRPPFNRPIFSRGSEWFCRSDRECFLVTVLIGVSA